jgi:hypothetical protein
MKAEELRIGNYYNKNGEIKQITPSDIIEVWESERIWCKPIPLTEEWLLKFGFELKKVSMGGREYEGWRNFSFHLDTNYIKNTLFYHWMGGNIEIKHVHQLQNLYFALTSEALTIK